MELNREQIIKALEYCNTAKRCIDCPYRESDCETLYPNALALIKELTEENERLRAIPEELYKEMSERMVEERKIERKLTVRKMQERFTFLLKKEFDKNTPEDASFYFKNGSIMMWGIGNRVFAQIAKEMLDTTECKNKGEEICKNIHQKK